MARLDRLGRNLLERVRARDELKAIGVVVHSATEGGDVSDLIAHVLAAVAQEESRQTSERVRAVKRLMIEGGWHPGGLAHWGYRHRAATAEERSVGAPRSVLEVDPAAAPYVREAFLRVARGDRKREVARWVASLPPDARGGRALGYYEIVSLLRQPVYVARPRSGDPTVLNRPVGRWPALVSDELWEQVRLRAQGRIRLSSGRFLLSGFLRCPHCGARVGGRARYRPRTPAYVCGGRGCVAFFGCAAPLDQEVMRRIRAMVETITTTDPVVAAALQRAWYRVRRPLAKGTAENQRRALDAGIDRARRRLAYAGALLADGDIDPAGYELVRALAETDLAACQTERAALNQATTGSTLPPLVALRRMARDWKRTLDGDDLQAQRWVLTALISDVLASRVERGRYELEIIWTPLGQALHAATQQARMAQTETERSAR